MGGVALALTAAQLEAHLGYFDRFMKAWGRASTSVREQVYEVTLAYRAGQIDARTEDVQVSALLGIAPPAVV